jgi:hypothetical protein
VSCGQPLRAYLEHGQSIAATAALRRRNRKTIVRQLPAAERLIDHTVSDRSDELLIALRIAEILHNRAQRLDARPELGGGSRNGPWTGGRPPLKVSA